MRTDLKLTTKVTAANPVSGDLDIDGHNISIVASGVKATRQRLEQRLSSVRGEWFLDLNYGTDWMPYLGTSNTSGLAQMLRRVILGTYGIKDVNSVRISLDAVSRLAKVSFTATTDDDNDVIVATEISI
jgi:hypothetical protein